MRHRLTVPAFFSALVLVLFLVGCWNPFKPDKKDDGNGGNGGGELLERTSPENVLTNLKTIYNNDHIVNTPEDAHYWAEAYRELFHPDSFKFYFLSKDVPDPIVYPGGWWGVEDEVAFFDSLFTGVASGQVDDIYLHWTVNPSVPDNRVDEHGQLVHPDWKWIHAISVYLEVTQGDMVYTVPGAEAEFYFGVDPADTTLWFMTEWLDRDTPGG